MEILEPTPVDYIDNYDKKYVTLSNGVQMPIVGFGVYLTPPEETERCVLEAIKAGYRLIDTAQAYCNEEGVGNAITKCGIPRNELFITTKVMISNPTYEKARESVLISMKKLQVDYIDLVLIHRPFSDYFSIWRALEDLYDEGKLKAIGVSNFQPDRLTDICMYNRHRPMVNQIETHPFYQQELAHQWMQRFNVQHESWSPLTNTRLKDLLSNPVITSIAKKHNKTAAQVALRFNVQRGIVVIPKSTHKERIIENFDIFDFVLTKEEMNQIKEIDQDQTSMMRADDPRNAERLCKLIEKFEAKSKKA